MPASKGLGGCNVIVSVTKLVICVVTSRVLVNVVVIGRFLKRIL